MWYFNEIDLKQIIPLILLSIVFAIFTAQKTSSLYLTQLVVTISGESQALLYESLEKDFSKMNGVKLCETSLMTKTLILNFDSQKVKTTDIKSVLKKWECSPDEYSYRKLPTARIEG